MKFISQNNTYEFDSVDWKNDLIALYIDNQYCVFEYTGVVKFLQDSNGVGEYWDDYELSEDFSVELIPELSDVDLVLLNLNKDFVIEWIVEELWKVLEKESEEF